MEDLRGAPAARTSPTRRSSSTRPCATASGSCLEGAQGTLLDLDHGTYPFVTSSNPVAGAAATGIGIGPTRIDSVIGVAKAYVTRVGEGPFPTEIEGPDQERVRELGEEYGTTTGRERRCGWLDLVGLRFAVAGERDDVARADKARRPLEFDEIPVCVRYRLRTARRPTEFPAHQSDFHHASPVYETLPAGTSRSTTGLPERRGDYVEFVARAVGVEVTLIGTGADRASG